MIPDLSDFLAAERLPADYAALVRRLHAPLAERIAVAARAKGSALVVGLTGSQASGKTTSAAVLARLLEAGGLRPAILALDDLYLPLAERRRLAAEVHPLLLTRGVPGTHDVGAGLAILQSLGRPGETLIPRFDKASDDRLAAGATLEGPFDVVLFEGWCVGARPQAPTALAAPVNDLERERDPDGAWRAYVNDALAGPYQGLFAPIDFQVLFAAPSFEAVLGWRIEQETKLRARLAEAGGAGRRGQSDAEIAVFIRHYERLTRHILAEMPARSDVVVRLAADRSVTGIDGL